MNIDYTAIITKANERKEALQAFERAVQGLRGEINEGGHPDLIEALYDFQKAEKNLDEEARQMLPVNGLQPLSLFVNNMLSMWAFVDKISGSALSVQVSPRAALDILAES